MWQSGSNQERETAGIWTGLAYVNKGQLERMGHIVVVIICYYD